MIVNYGNFTPQRTVVIVGVQRGGTSMVAGVVRELGVNLGTSLGLNHEDPEFVSTDIREILPVVERRNSALDVWGWKMPHASEYLLQLLPELRNPFVIVVFRNLLSTAESNVKRSGAEFLESFEFSARRFQQVASIIPKMKTPLMLVNYEQAVARPGNLVAELSEFLNISPSDDERERAMRMIDPQKGYKRSFEEDWSFVVSRAETFDLSNFEELRPPRQDARIAVAENWLQRAGDNPHIAFTKLGGRRKIHMSVVRRGEPDFIRLCVNTAGSYTDGLTDHVGLFPGGNVITIEAQRINGLLIYPQFVGQWSNAGLFRLFAAKS